MDKPPVVMIKKMHKKAIPSTTKMGTVQATAVMMIQPAALPVAAAPPAVVVAVAAPVAGQKKAKQKEVA
jgi:hypothetical protein